MSFSKQCLVFCLFYIGFLGIANAQLFSRYKNCDKKLIEAIIENNRQINDEKLLDTVFLKLAKEATIGDGDCIDIVKLVLKAEVFARRIDYLNDTSSQLYEKALQIATEKNKPQMQIWASINYAFYLYSYGNYEAALPNFIKVGRLAESFPGEEMIFAGDTYKKLGYFTGYIREYDKGIEYLKMAEKYTAVSSVDMAALKDNIGLFYIKNNKPEDAVQYFEQALKIAIAAKDTLRQAKVLGNMADLYKRKRNYNKAIQLLHQDIFLSKKSGNNMNTMFAMLRLTEVYLETGDVTKARLSALNALSIAQSKVYFKQSEFEATTFLLKIAQKMGDSETELQMRRKIDSLSIDLKIAEGTNSISKLNWEVQKQNFNEELSKEKGRVNRASMVRNSILALSVILVLAATIIFINQRKKSKKISAEHQTTLSKLQAEKIKSEIKLNEANSSLTAYLTYLSEKNEQIAILEQEIETLKNIEQSDEDKEALQDLLQSHLMTDENWNRFKTAFARENPVYYNTLTANYPELTESNLRIILLQKLGLTNNETAQLLGITVDAVKKAKQRLKKKLNGHYEEILGMSES